MLTEGLRQLVQVWVRPGAAMGSILDRGSAWFALLLALAVSVGLRAAAPVPFGLLTPVLTLAVIYVPGLTLIAGLVARGGTHFQRDYAALLACTAMAWSAAAIPFTAVAFALPERALGIAAIVACLYFAFLMFFAVRTLFGLGGGAAFAAVALSWIPLAAVALLWGPIRFLFGWLASPLFLFYLWYFLGGELKDLGSGLRGGQQYRRMLEAAAVNPHDADAQYQLGLIHLERRQDTEAARRFRNATAIDREATGAHFELGRIARRQGRVAEALEEFQTVLRQDERHSSYEARRDLGAALLDAGRLPEARRELEIYADRRPYDPEGLYYLGLAMEKQGDQPGARDAYSRAIEAARTAPRYRRRVVAQWSRLAQQHAQGI